jgi:IQ calmodulin-binding motif
MAKGVEEQSHVIEDSKREEKNTKKKAAPELTRRKAEKGAVERPAQEAASSRNIEDETRREEKSLVPEEKVGRPKEGQESHEAAASSSATSNSERDKLAAVFFIQRWWRGMAAANGAVNMDAINVKTGRSAYISMTKEKIRGTIAATLGQHWEALGQMDRQLRTVQTQIDAYAAARPIQPLWSKEAAALTNSAGKTLKLHQSDHAETRSKAAHIVQKWWRKKCQKSPSSKTLVGRIDADTNDEEAGTSSGESKPIRIEATTSMAAVLVQQWWRGLTEISLHEKKEYRQVNIDHAANTVQRWWKRSLCSTNVNYAKPTQAPLASTAPAAIAIQDWWRRTKTRSQPQVASSSKSQYQMTSVQETTAAKRIQRWWQRAAAAAEKTTAEESEIPSAKQLHQNPEDSFFTDVQRIQESLTESMQVTLASVKTSWALLSSNPRTFFGGQKDVFLARVNALEREQEQSINLWKASLSHYEKVMAAKALQRWWRRWLESHPLPSEEEAIVLLTPSVLKLQSWWRMHVAQKNYQRLQTVTRFLPGSTTKYMVSKIRGPQLWGSQVRVYLRTRYRFGQSFYS